ncbi:hypothetical protein [Opitutus sp. ER46]|uniref:hypothetical protein n=1 Tax=Opitutus sp. ER46 TaxID=2161864 RepID=UPI000D31E4EC|nr:hypothetical protein [Opitutus sp. ER46]PTX92568.1 hypothetical protein DB354_14660 [Opitutus sp. ER46]
MTAAPPARVVLTADRTQVSPDWEDVVRVTATIVDAAGVRVPSAAHLVSFRAEGPGHVVAVDDGDNTSHEAFHATERTAIQGRCVAYVRASAGRGVIVLRASVAGLAPGELQIAAASTR